jgi:tRNA threonylcarbamoyladenosine biosynthesis protein TsaB
MPLILHIETATNVCSIALAGDGQLLSLRESTIRNSHAAIITRLIDEVMLSSKRELKALDAIAVSKGPGSYTGLRIGVATAKGLCYALDKPLIALPTLQSMASGIRLQASGIRHPASGIKRSASNDQILFCPMIDARRMEVYYALYDLNGNEILGTRAEIIGENSFSDLLVDYTIIFGGDGSLKCREVLKSQKKAIFIDEFNASAKDMIALGEDKFGRQEIEDLAYFEPFYLKDFIAGKARVKGLH